MSNFILGVYSFAVLLIGSSGRFAEWGSIARSPVRPRSDMYGNCLRVANLPIGFPLAKGRISSPYTDERMDPILHRLLPHHGVDIAAPWGTPILATGDGFVLAVARTPTYGRAIDIVHGVGVISRYAHAANVFVRPGMAVHRGQTIALVGVTGRTTGPHLHYEIFMHWRSVDPLLIWKSVGKRYCEASR